MLYFRRTMVMEEEEEERWRRDAAISTNCDIRVLPLSLSLPSTAILNTKEGCVNFECISIWESTGNELM